MTSHLTRDELAAWLSDARDRDRIVSHLAECDECGALFGEVMDARVNVPAATADEARALAWRAYRAYRPSASATQRRVFTRFAPAGLAAAVVLILAMFLRPALTPQKTTNDDVAVRGATIETISPAGTVRPRFDFQWASPIAGVKYRVDVYDDAGRVLVSAHSDRERVDSARVLGGVTLEPGRTYRWKITAVDSAGAEIMSSPLRPFVVSGVSR